MNVKRSNVCQTLTETRIYVLKMRYKDQALDKLNQLTNITRTLDFQVSRLESQESILQTIQDLKEKIEDIQSIISIEHDEFSSYV